MPDLHERLTAAVNARLEVAREAGADWGPGWMITRVQPYTDPVVLGSSDGDNFTVVGTVDVEVPEQIHIAANDPATVIRHCERDLKVLERHAPLAARHLGGELICAYEWGDGDGWDVPWHECPDIADLATAYGVEVLE